MPRRTVMGYEARMMIWNGDNFGVEIGLGVSEVTFPFNGGDKTLPFVFSRGKVEDSILTVLVEQYKILMTLRKEEFCEIFRL